MPPADEFGREVTGIRVSLTDRCNFDCVYCHNEGLGDPVQRLGVLDAGEVADFLVLGDRLEIRRTILPLCVI